MPIESLKKITMKEWAGIAIVLISLGAIAYLSFVTRSATLDTRTVLDYDPWWFFRYAQYIVEHGFTLPKWDELSYYPPGRPIEVYEGWPYTIAIMYTVARFFTATTLVEVAKLSPILMVLFAIPPAYVLGKTLSNKWGGIFTALFSVLTPTFIGVSMGGYCDSDVVVVLWSILLVLTVFLALKKRTIPYIALAILVNTAFVYSWARGWYILLLFTAFIPLLMIFRAIQEIFAQRRFKIDLAPIIAEAKKLFIPLTIILVVTNIIGVVFNLSNIYYIIVGGYAFINGNKLIVNQSVAELQPVNILTQDGFMQVASRIGLGPFLFTIIGLPLLVLLKLYKKVKIEYTEIFLFIWALVTFFLITRGVRFSLMFSLATAAATGYVIGNVMLLMKNRVLLATFIGVVIMFSLMFLNDAMVAANQASGMEISGNWYAMLDWLKANADSKAMVATWWDPGHIITGYTGLRVHADGAHCGVGECVPYNHNIRIQDMGRILATTSENESISILSKYNGLDAQTCASARSQIKATYGVDMPADACDAPSEMYVIASSDLIGKYYWLSYYGLNKGENFFQMSISGYDSNQGIISYAGGQFSLVWQNDQWVPVLNIPAQGIRNVVVREVVYFENGQQIHLISNATNTIDGMIWVDSSFNTVVFMSPTIRDSMFTRMFFFNGYGLQHFQLVYSNAEIKLYKVIF